MEMALNIIQDGPILAGEAGPIAEQLVNIRVDQGREASRVQAQVNAPKKTGAMAAGVIVAGESVVSMAPYSQFVESGHRQGKRNPVQVPAHPWFGLPNVAEAFVEEVNMAPGDIVAALG